MITLLLPRIWASRSLNSDFVFAALLFGFDLVGCSMVTPEGISSIVMCVSSGSSKRTSLWHSNGSRPLLWAASGDRWSPSCGSFLLLLLLLRRCCLATHGTWESFLGLFLPFLFIGLLSGTLITLWRVLNKDKKKDHMMTQLCLVTTVWVVIYMCIFTTFEEICVAGSNLSVFLHLMLLHDWPIVSSWGERVSKASWWNEAAL